MKPLGSTIVIRPGALGDAVLTLPALLHLRRAGARPLNVLGTPSSWGFLNRDCDGLRFFDFTSSAWLGLFADGANISAEAKSLLSETELVVAYLEDETGAFKSRLEAFGVKQVIVSKPPIARGVDHASAFFGSKFSPMTGNPQKMLSSDHAARRLMDPLHALVAPNLHQKSLAPELLEETGWLKPTDEERRDAQTFLDQLRAKFALRDFIAIHPGSGGRQKCWPAINFAELTERVFQELKHIPLVLFGPADDQTRDAFLRSIRPTNSNWVALENRPLRELFSILCECRAFVGNDAGMTHLAARATKTLAIFGPTNVFHWCPLGSEVMRIVAPEGDLKKLSIDSVFEAVKSL